MTISNGPYTKFTGLVKQYKKVETGLVALFKTRPGNIFGGDKVTYDIVKRARTLPGAKESTGAYETLATDKYKNREHTPPAYKPRTNFAMGQAAGRQAGTLITDEIDKTAILMDKTASDIALLLDRIERGMTLQAWEIFQFGKIRFASVYNYPVADIDFDCPSAHFATVSTLWTAGAGNPLLDLETHMDLIETNGLEKVDNICFGTAALNAFLQNTQVRAELDLRRLDKGNLTFGEVQSNGMARVGVYNFSGTIVTFWTYKEWYQTVDANDVVTGTARFLDTNKVVMWASTGDYQRYYGGVDTIKTVPKDLTGFLPTNNITIIGDKLATSVYIDTKEVSDGSNEGVYLRAVSRPLLTPRTNDVFGCLEVL